MIEDFVRFAKEVWRLLRFIRGVLLVLLLILLGCALVFEVAEGLRFGEALYLTAITALTVGYGDISPATPIGRIAAVVAGLVGVLFVGIVVAVATRALALATQEKLGIQRDPRRREPGTDRRN